jgi:hypothetical protein
MALLPETEFLAALARADEGERRFAATLRGWPQERMALWEEVHRLGDPPPPLALLELLYRHRRALGEAWVRRHGLRVLTPEYPKSLQWPRRLGGAPPTRQEEALVAAWHAEDGRDGPSIEET